MRATGGTETLLRLENDGQTEFIINNTTQAPVWKFAEDTVGSFLISVDGSGVQEVCVGFERETWRLPVAW